MKLFKFIFNKKQKKKLENPIAFLPTECQIYFYMWKHIREEGQYLLINVKPPYDILII